MIELKYVESLEEFRLGSPHILQFAMTIERATGLVEAIRQATAAPPIRQMADIRS
jgi:hypothetical protein